MYAHRMHNINYDETETQSRWKSNRKQIIIQKETIGDMYSIKKSKNLHDCNAAALISDLLLISRSLAGKQKLVKYFYQISKI